MRKLFAVILVFISLVLWVVPSDIVKLIVLQRPILIGRYAQGHFASLLLLTPMLWLLAGVLFSSLSLNKRLLINTGLLVASSLFSILFVVWLSKLIITPRYVEENFSIEGGASQRWQGTIRHRPPNKRYVYTQVDIPIQVRSYPNPPAGYPDVPITLTSDANGYRNADITDHYEIVVIGDSFAAGSRVSDEQAWPVLLSELSGMGLYNLGTSGTDIYNYISSLIAKGLKLKPKVVVLMIYEGNDFKRVAKQAKPEEATFSDSLKDSPLTASLKKLSRSVFESINASEDVPAYNKNLSWMPVKIDSGDEPHYYSFKPQRVKYLSVERSKFENSKVWKSNIILLDKFIALSKENNFTPVIAYAPSKPHVVLPLVDIPAEGFKHFLSYKMKNLPSADVVKDSFYSNLDAQEKTVEAYCQDRGISFVSTTSKLQSMTDAGMQLYYTYDQHWTPKGNEVVADIIYQHLSKIDLLSSTDLQTL
ncbi:MAG: hypothetical protein JKY88_06725 [Pseudomonadales bacterium]|nr:hypothetical protein [Pseudomonadales bacterium]